MRRVYWDTMLYAYWMEGHPSYGPRIAAIHDAMSRRQDRLCASTLVCAEMLVGPTILGDAAGSQAIQSFFESSEVEILPFPLQASPMFAQLRASGLKPPDAMHLAIAAHASVDLFITNDRRLHKIAVPGLPFIATLETDLF